MRSASCPSCPGRQNSGAGANSLYGAIANLVIPAQATPLASPRRKPGSSFSLRASGASWIPASAGMTQAGKRRRVGNGARSCSRAIAQKKKCRCPPKRWWARFASPTLRNHSPPNPRVSWLTYTSLTSSIEGRCREASCKRDGVRCPCGPVTQTGARGGVGLPRVHYDELRLWRSLNRLVAEASSHPLPRGERGGTRCGRHRFSPLPLWERAFRRELARAKLLRKSHGGKGEGLRGVPEPLAGALAPAKPSHYVPRARKTRAMTGHRCKRREERWDLVLARASRPRPPARTFA
jgi:hypothetical protein